MRFEEVARKARRVQDAIEAVRVSVSVPGVRIEVAADGRITALTLPDQALAEAISDAHAHALRRAGEQAARLRRELADDPVVAALRRSFDGLHSGEPESGPRATRTAPAENTDDDRNPYALPPEVRRRYGL